MNNILGIMYGHLSMAEEDLPEDHPVQQNLQSIKKASQRGTDLVRRILNVSSPRPPNDTVVNPQVVLVEVVALLRSTLPAMINIRTDVDSSAPMIKGDSTQLHQVFMNLATNASHAMEHQVNGTLGLELKSIQIDEDTVALSPNLRVGPYVRISISDTGHGMDRNTLERIFEPFFTTKPAGKGTGLGLAIVHGIIRSHGGAQTVYSDIGRGTTFRIYIPAAIGARVDDTTGAHINPKPGSGQKIICVDDEEELLDVSAALLTRMGFIVTKYSNPLEAISVIAAAPEDFDAVMTDHSMPGITGIQLAEKVRALREDLPLILMSGNFRDQEIEETNRIGMYRIGKPATRDELLALMARVFPE